MQDGLSAAEKVTNCETFNHISQVCYYLGKIQRELINRMARHDDTKLRSPELEAFVEFTPRLKNSTYGSEQYKCFLAEMQPALKHHYACHRHHPEHFENGIDDMNLIDLIEMVCDWYAASKRHDDGNIKDSLKINKARFKISDQLEKILENTLAELDG